jgi:hypothetical protein
MIGRSSVLTRRLCRHKTNATRLNKIWATGIKGVNMLTLEHNQQKVHVFERKFHKSKGCIAYEINERWRNFIHVIRSLLWSIGAPAVEPSSDQARAGWGWLGC